MVAPVITMRLDPLLVTAADEMADKLGITRSGLIRIALTRFLVINANLLSDETRMKIAGWTRVQAMRNGGDIKTALMTAIGEAKKAVKKAKENIYRPHLALPELQKAERMLDYALSLLL